ncbi:MAG TPA: diacylglycerol kinase family protein [Allosphingosinicella sp.]|nr:diacylglycerol kinase family protein [Allosphingosinicella sp.]
MSGSFVVQSSSKSANMGRRWRCFGHAFDGLIFLQRNEPNARVHLFATVAVIALAATLRVSLEDWRWLILAITLVWAAEGLNTAVEQLCNRVSPGFDPRIKAAKDVAAAAVLVSAAAAAAIGALTFFPYLARALAAAR